MKINNLLVDILAKAKRKLVTTSSEPQVEQKRDRYGNKYWHVNDLQNHRSYTFGSEQDVRVWLENRHYRFN